MPITLIQHNNDLLRHQRTVRLTNRIFDKQIDKKIAVKFLPGLEKYYPDVSNEGILDIDDDMADRIVDTGINVATKLIRAAWKLAQALWKRLLELGQRFLKFLETCQHKGKRIKNRLRLSAAEGRKVIEAVKQHCTNLVNQGVPSDHELPKYVDLVIKTTSVMNKPFDETNPSSVKQWLESINYSAISFTSIDGLKYVIPQEKWNLFAYNPKFEVMSLDYVIKQKELNNYYFKLITQAKDHLSESRFIFLVREQLAGKIKIDTLDFLEKLCAKILEPFLKLEVPYIEGNITRDKAVWLSKTTMTETFKKSHDKINGLTAALEIYTPKITESNPKLYIKPYSFHTTLPAMAKFVEEVENTIDVMTTNTYQLYKHNPVAPALISEQNLRRILQDNNVKVDNLDNFIKGLINTSRACDMVLNKFITYHSQLNACQLRVLEMQREAILQFLPDIHA